MDRAAAPSQSLTPPHDHLLPTLCRACNRAATVHYAGVFRHLRFCSQRFSACQARDGHGAQHSLLQKGLCDRGLASEYGRASDCQSVSSQAAPQKGVELRVVLGAVFVAIMQIGLLVYSQCEHGTAQPDFDCGKRVLTSDHF
jgi:hypothetical protein